MIKYDIEIERRIPKEWISERKRTMFAVNRKSYIYLESLKNASLDYKERSFTFACLDKIRLVRKTVMKDVGLPE